MMNSCNPVLIDVGQRLGVEGYYGYFEQFGLKAKTGIDIPGEASTIMHKKEAMGPVELATVSFGQSFQITPVQLVATVSSIINGGERVTPHFGVAVQSSDKTWMRSFSYPLGRRILSEETSQTMRYILEQVVSQGSGKKAAIEGFRIGGKTATSEKLPRSLKRYISSFIGFAPADDPQVIALIMAYMDTTQAAQILEELPDDKRIQTVQSMAKMDRVSPEAIAIVEEEMKRKFATIITSEDNMSLGGVDYVADMMNHIDRSSERKIFEELDKSDPDLSQEIRDKMFVFENILDMDDRSIQRFIRELDAKDVVFALKNATEEMKTLFFNNMSKRMSETVKGDLEITTNVRLKDVEEAQQRIVNVIRNLEERGEVIIKKGGADDDIIL